MIPESLQFLAVALAVLALVALVVALVLWRRTRGVTIPSAALVQRLDERAQRLPAAIGTARANLAERTATIEHGLWLMARADAQIEATTVALRQRRVSLDQLREKMERSRARAETLKSTARMIIRALELRRTFL
ncbi:MAG TPA: hypothetical protein VMZ33_06710 [Candidatus Limnocylindrales bacterium]|nr:hypothetical protein [Candidatus Limnocylindrales bacterium]